MQFCDWTLPECCELFHNGLSGSQHHKVGRNAACVWMSTWGQNEPRSAKMRRRLIGRIVLVLSHRVPGKRRVQRLTELDPDASGCVCRAKNNWGERQEEEVQLIWNKQVNRGERSKG